MERRNAGTPERRSAGSTKTRNAGILKPGTPEYLNPERRNTLTLNDRFNVHKIVDLPTSRAQSVFFFGSAIAELRNPKIPSARERELDLFLLQEIASSDVILTGTVLGIVSVVCLVGGSVKHFLRNGKIIGTPTKTFVHVAVAENIWQQYSD